MRMTLRMAGCSGSNSAGHAAVGPVDGQAVLDQVVGADAEEVRLGGQQVDGQRGGGHLDHDADGHRAPSSARVPPPRRVADRSAAFASRSSSTLDTKGSSTRTAPCRPALASARNWVSNASRCPRLRRIARRPSGPRDRPASRARAAVVLLPCRAARGLRLVDVERADGDGVGRHPLDEIAVDAVLRLLVERLDGAAAQQELGSEQPDAFGAGRPGAVDLLQALDVGLEPDGHAVDGHDRAGHPRRRRPDTRRPPFAPRPRPLDRPPATGSMTTSPASPSTSTRVPGLMCFVTAGAPATAGRPSDRARMAEWWVRLPVSNASPRIMAGSSCAATDGASSSATSTAGAARSASRRGAPRGGRHQVAAEPPDDVGDVAAALAQVFVAHLREDGAELVERPVQRPFRVHVLRLDDAPGARHEQLVVQHQQLRLEQAGEIGARPLRHPGMDGAQLATLVSRASSRRPTSRSTCAPAMPKRMAG